MSRWTIAFASLTVVAFSFAAIAADDTLPRNIELKPGAAGSGDTEAAEDASPPATTRQIVTEPANAAPAANDAAPPATATAATPAAAPAAAGTAPTGSSSSVSATGSGSAPKPGRRRAARKCSFARSGTAWRRIPRERRA